MEKFLKRLFKNSIVAQDGFWVGFGSLFDLSGNYYTYKFHPDADSKAIESDWKAIGDDIWESVHIAQPKKKTEKNG